MGVFIFFVHTGMVLMHREIQLWHLPIARRLHGLRVRSANPARWRWLAFAVLAAISLVLM
jgi:hypothetical protein